jgi:hypothetical protein
MTEVEEVKQECSTLAERLAQVLIAVEGVQAQLELGDYKKAWDRWEACPVVEIDLYPVSSTLFRLATGREDL